MLETLAGSDSTPVFIPFVMALYLKKLHFDHWNRDIFSFGTDSIGKRLLLVFPRGNFVSCFVCLVTVCNNHLMARRRVVALSRILRIDKSARVATASQSHGRVDAKIKPSRRNSKSFSKSFLIKPN